MAKIFVGTSGWVYSDWEGIFYPSGLSLKEKLKYYSSYFNTTEINYSFYHLPRPSTYQNWYKNTPNDFVFSLKTPRLITHLKRLKGVKNIFKKFLNDALNLKEKIACLLFQFPANFKNSEKNFKRLTNFLDFINKKNFKSLKYALEFRHQSWFCKNIYDLLKKYNNCLVLADSSRYPKAEILTADFLYFRFHGPKSLFSSKYSKKELQLIAQKIKKWANKKDTFVYFNNDFSGYAIENAKTLKSLLNI